MVFLGRRPRLQREEQTLAGRVRRDAHGIQRVVVARRIVVEQHQAADIGCLDEKFGV
ncbi:hypothetical protein ACVFYP_19595 [Roseomonas sp. F4]